MWIEPAKRQSVSTMSADELFAELVQDAEILIATPMPRMVAAYNKIAREWRMKIDDVFAKVVNEKAQRTGSRLMPL